MEIGFAGLGRMGLNMVKRLVPAGHRVVAYNRSQEKVREVEALGAIGADSLAALVGELKAPRSVWVMVPAGDVTQAVIDELVPLLDAGDLIIDGGNSRFHDTIRRGDELAASGINFVDVGTSGGIWGLEVGYCMMAGGNGDMIRRLTPALDTLAPPDGWLHVGSLGSGHYVKMVHNGIEYGMMEAYAEGFEILRESQFELDLGKISHLWNQGSVVRSWLLELAERAFGDDPDLEKLQDYVSDSGEGRWTVFEAIDRDVPAPVLTLALIQRLRSRQSDSFAMKVLAALRQQFGGHAVKPTSGVT